MYRIPTDHGWPDNWGRQERRNGAAYRFLLPQPPCLAICWTSADAPHLWHPSRKLQRQLTMYDWNSSFIRGNWSCWHLPFLHQIGEKVITLILWTYFRYLGKFKVVLVTLLWLVVWMVIVLYFCSLLVIPQYDFFTPPSSSLVGHHRSCLFCHENLLLWPHRLLSYCFYCVTTSTKQESDIDDNGVIYDIRKKNQIKK